MDFQKYFDAIFKSIVFAVILLSTTGSGLKRGIATLNLKVLGKHEREMADPVLRKPEQDSDEEMKSILEEQYRFKNDGTSTRYKITKEDRENTQCLESSEKSEIAWAFRTYAVRRIVGGMETSISMYPYNVAISRNGKHWCGGSIIDEQWVLTAGHCLEAAFDGDKKKLYPFIVRAGSSFHNRGGYQARVNKVFFPKTYAPGNADFDFSLLRLDRPMPVGRNIAVLNLPSKDYVIKNQDILIVTGWGSTHESGYAHIPDRLRFVPVPVMRMEDCQDSYRFYITPRMLCAGYATGGKDACNESGYAHIPDRLRFVPVPVMRMEDCQDSYRFYITPRMLCAGYATGGKDACNHDSGGPAVRDGVLLGIVSFGGKQCGDPRSPGVYSRVSELTEWVERTISDNEASLVPELQEKIKKARERESELQRFKARVEDKKNKIKSWLRETLKSPAFIELAKRKLKEVGVNMRRSASLPIMEAQNVSYLDDKAIDDINLSNLINERILENDEKNEDEQMLRTLALKGIMLDENEEGDKDENFEGMVAYVLGK